MYSAENNLKIPPINIWRQGNLIINMRQNWKFIFYKSLTWVDGQHRMVKILPQEAWVHIPDDSPIPHQSYIKATAWDREIGTTL